MTNLKNIVAMKWIILATVSVGAFFIQVFGNCEWALNILWSYVLINSVWQLVENEKQKNGGIAK